VNIDEYTSFSLQKGTSSAIIVVPNKEDAQKLLQFHLNNNAIRLHLYEGILSTENDFLPMPDLVISRLRQKCSATDSVVLTGLSPYLTLLNEEQRKALLNSLKDWIDDTNSSVIIVLCAQWENDLKNVFTHPRYRESKKLIFLKGAQTAPCILPNIALVDQKWIEINPPIYDAFVDYLRKSNDFPEENLESITIAMPLSKNLAGLNPSIEQIITLRELMRKFYNINDLLKDSVLQFILSKAQELKKTKGLDCIRSHYGDLKDVLRTAPKRIVDCRNEAETEAILWMLKQSVPPDSYLHYVLDTCCSANNFLHRYAVNEAFNQLENDNARRFAEERKTALKEINQNVVLSHIVQFINGTKDKPIQKIALWLNCGTQEEHAELVRRCKTDSIYDSISQQVFSVYPTLEKYLIDYDYGDTQLNDYFKHYRKQKVWNTVMEDFCKKAYAGNIPENMVSRSIALQPYINDGKTALLLVDAMGVEYLPLLCTLAYDYGINIKHHQAVYVSLPSSTPYNRIEWNNDFRLTEIKSLDTIVHDGAEQHQSDYAENLVAVLDKVFSQIFIKIKEALGSFEQVLLTADHGASRLAVLAKELGLTRTLENPNVTPPADWRYCQKPPQGQCPPEFTETLDGKFWVVRGYNRLPKQGGKFNEIHGGATLEETLVPVVLFTRDSTTSLTSEIPQKPVKQLIEKDDFDI